MEWKMWCGRLGKKPWSPEVFARWRRYRAYSTGIIGELLVHLGYVERSVVEAFVIEQLKDAMAELLSWPIAAHKFRKTKKTRQDVAPPMSVRDLLAEVEQRRHRWDELMVSIGGERGIPMLSARPDGAADVVLSSADWALLCKVDGERDIAELAAAFGVEPNTD